MTMVGPDSHWSVAAGVAMGLRYLHSSSGGSGGGGSTGSRKQKRQKNSSSHSGPDWWRHWEAPTLPPATQRRRLGRRQGHIMVANAYILIVHLSMWRY